MCRCVCVSECGYNIHAPVCMCVCEGVYGGVCVCMSIHRCVDVIPVSFGGESYSSFASCAQCLCRTHGSSVAIIVLWAL